MVTWSSSLRSMEVSSPSSINRKQSSESELLTLDEEDKHFHLIVSTTCKGGYGTLYLIYLHKSYVKVLHRFKNDFFVYVVIITVYRIVHDQLIITTYSSLNCLC